MVLIGVGITTRKGQVLVSRQFVDMTRSRVEGLMGVLPRLINRSSSNNDGGQSQHTFVETEELRYLYQPIEKLFLVLLTTKSSNIIEDLQALKLFAKLVPEYCKSLTEACVNQNAFELIFAFDEVVSFGYREDVNLSQVRSITDMDSNDERIYLAMRESQVRETKEKMKEKARELEMQRKLQRSGVRINTGVGYSSSGPPISMSNNDFKPKMSSEVPSTRFTPSHDTNTRKKPHRVLKLGKKKGMEALISDLDNPVADDVTAMDSDAAHVISEPVQFRSEEKLSVTMPQEGLPTMEVSGLLYLKINEQQFAHIQAKVEHGNNKPIQIQTHPHINKKEFLNSNLLMMSQPEKPFPVNTDIYVLKWRLSGNTEEELPLTVNCWPHKTTRGMEMTVEFQLADTSLTLANLVVSIPIPANCTPIVSRNDNGDYKIDRKSGCFDWNVGLVDEMNDQGILEFHAVTHATQREFYPVTVNFTSKDNLSGLTITEVTNVNDDTSLPFSFSSELTANKFVIE